MLKERITVKDLKQFLNECDENSEVFVNIYENDKYKEYLTIREYDDAGKMAIKELCIVSVKENEK